MLKVLHLIQGYGGGISSLVKNLILSADKTQIRQDVMSFAYQNGELFVEELKKYGSNVFLMPRPRKDGYFAFKSYVLKVMKDGGYDVVHCHTDGWRSTVFKKIAKKAGISVFCIHAHRTSNNPGFIQNNKVYIKFNQWISRKNADIRFTCGVEAAKFIYGTTESTITIPNGISLERCKKAWSVDIKALKTELGIFDDEIILLHVGRFVVQKNHMFMIDIAEKLRNKGVKFKLLLVGAGDLEKSVREKTAEKNLFDSVVFLGRRNDIFDLMHMADVMLLPSTSEGLPTVAIEAQAMGLYSLISNQVSDEVDMGLGLLSFLSIDDATVWVNDIENLHFSKDLSIDRIEPTLTQNAYTDRKSFERYITVLNDKVNFQ